MKHNKCPFKNRCKDYEFGKCDRCKARETDKRKNDKIYKLEAENLKLKAENEELKSRIDVLLNPNF